MRSGAKKLTIFFSLAVAAGPAAVIEQKRYMGPLPVGATQTPIAYLWREPKDLASENLFYGRGGQQHAPQGPFTFQSEDLEGTNPKFDVRGPDGVKWKIKLGAEARPETVASRFVWAVGYHANEDYFMPEVQVMGLPEHVHRGQDLIEAGGVMRNVRLKREEGKKVGIWSWGDNPFAGTRELAGLRVMMAVVNNWDLKDVNNAIRDYEKGDENGDTREYEVSDLGASFGTTNRELSHTKSKGNLESYASSTFIARVEPDFVDFKLPGRPSLPVIFNPREYAERMGMRWIGDAIPRSNARWIGDLLGQLSADQIRDAFRAAGYEGEELDGFTAEFQKRIAALKQL